MSTTFSQKLDELRRLFKETEALCFRLVEESENATGDEKRAIDEKFLAACELQEKVGEQLKDAEAINISIPATPLSPEKARKPDEVVDMYIRNKALQVELARMEHARQQAGRHTQQAEQHTQRAKPRFLLPLRDRHEFGSPREYFNYLQTEIRDAGEQSSKFQWLATEAKKRKKTDHEKAFSDHRIRADKRKAEALACLAKIS